MMKNNHLEKEIEWLLKEKYKGDKNNNFTLDVARLKNGEPLDYIIGFTPFLGCSIDLSQKPLIPRTETEFWVEKALHEIQRKEGSKLLNILDLFAGSGCIGVSLLKNVSYSHVDFGEYDENLLNQITENININDVEIKRTQIYQTDCFDNIPKDNVYDYIFANPPYISEGRIKDIQTSVLKNEPHKALFADDDGLFYIKKLISEGISYLKQGGSIYIEFDAFQKKDIENYIPKDIYDFSFQKDQFEKWRTVHLIKK